MLLDVHLYWGILNILIWKSGEVASSLLPHWFFFSTYPHFSHISCITLTWEKSNVANGWFKIYCSTFKTVLKAAFPKGLSYFSWSSLLEAAPVLNSNYICISWLFYTFTLCRWAQAPEDLSHVLKSCTDHALHDLNFGSQHFTVLLTWPFSLTSQRTTISFLTIFCLCWA